MNKIGKVGIEQLILGILIFSIVMIFGVSMIGDINNNYNLSLSTEMYNSSIYDRINSTYALTQGMENDTLGADISEDTGPWESMAKGSYSAVRLIGNSFGIFGAMAEYIAKEMHIPSYFVKAVMTAFTVFIVFSLIYLVMGVIRN